MVCIDTRFNLDKFFSLIRQNSQIVPKYELQKIISMIWNDLEETMVSIKDKHS